METDWNLVTGKELSLVAQKRPQCNFSLQYQYKIEILRVKRLKICLHCSIEKMETNMETKNSLDYVAWSI